jgi:hypothetical protein
VKALTTTTSVVRVTGSQAVADLEVKASWVDAPNPVLSTSSYTVTGDLPTNITTTTVTPVVPAPAASTARNVRELSVYNNGAAANVVTIEEFDGTDQATLWKGSLGIGEWVALDEVGVWTVYDSSGQQKVSPGAGRFIGQTVLTSGTSFVTNAATRSIRLRMVGGGGGGGGANTAATSAAAGSGGAGGGYAEKVFSVAPNTAYTYAIGAAGAAGAAAGGNGTAGGNTTFTVGATTVTAFGGPLGTGSAGAATPLTIAGGAAPAISTLGDLNGSGQPGGSSERQTATIAESGAGGGSIYGGGGVARVAQSAGANGTAAGSGGSGGCCINGGAAAAGGAGVAGLVVVEEYS